jgi:serine/threonine-protein kinase RsbW
MSRANVLTVPGRYDAVRGICEFVSAGATAAGMNTKAVFQVELACDEAATNIIEHAYGAEDVGTITVQYARTGRDFTVTLQDNGRSFDPSAVPPPPTVATEITDVTPDELGSQLQVGGLGLHLIRKLMDEVYFSFDPQSGNTLTLVKRLEERGTS